MYNNNIYINNVLMQNAVAADDSKSSLTQFPTFQLPVNIRIMFGIIRQTWLKGSFCKHTAR